MTTGFVHSVPVPKFYKVTANIAKSVQEEGASLKSLLYNKSKRNVKGTLALATSTLKHGAHLDAIIQKSKILLKEPRLDPWLARVLIAELLWGKKALHSECKPVKTVLKYRKKLLASIEGDDTTLFEKVEKPRYVRVNTLKTTVDSVISLFQEYGWTFETAPKSYSKFIDAVKKLGEKSFLRDINVPELLVFPPGSQFSAYDEYKNGELILQDKASCLPAFLLDAQPGSVVLDMCAAPGMKTTHLAAIMQNKGKIYASDFDNNRYRTLCKIVDNAKATCVQAMNIDAAKLNKEQCPNLKYILVDPSCSGSGMVDRLDAERDLPPYRIKSLQSFQVLLLRHALLGFPSVKRVVYSTCSLKPEENEQVVAEILTNIGDSYKLLSAKDLLKGLWINTGSEEYDFGDKCLYAKPDDDMTNGFFVAVFERNQDVPLPEYTFVGKNLKRNQNANQIGDRKFVIDNSSKRLARTIVDKKETEFDKKGFKRKPKKELEENGTEEENVVKSSKKKGKRLECKKELENGNAEAKDATTSLDSSPPINLEPKTLEETEAENAVNSPKKKRKRSKHKQNLENDNAEAKNATSLDSSLSIKLESKEIDTVSRKSKKKKKKLNDN